MLTFLARRLALGVLTVFAVSVLSFLIMKLTPGDYVTAYIAQQASSGSPVSAEEAANLRHQYGLDRPAPVQYGLWIGRMLQGNFGQSMEWRRPVMDVIADRLLLTVVVSLAAVFFTWIVALPIGIFSAVRQYSVLDYLFTFLGFFGLAVPGFLLALVLMYLGFRLFNMNIGGLFSSQYAEAPWSPGRVLDLLAHLPLPALILGLGGAAQLIRVVRANLLDELRKPYVMTARAKGLPPARVVMKYPVRLALNPFVSTIGYVFPFIVSGSIIVSLVLGLPTVGPVLLKALLAQDQYLAGTIILLLGLMTVAGTLISDLLLMWIDPRIRQA
jgi:peptide/nickel transport system permease protein